MSKPIKCRLLVPDGNGENRDYNELSAEEKEAFGAKISGRMGAALNDYFSTHIEAYTKLEGIDGTDT